MPDINLHRKHDLGLTKAREIASAWADKVQQKFGMQCKVIEGETFDTMEFSRSGAKGHLIVAADHFDLHAKVGLLLGPFSKTIEAEIQKQLDALLGAEPGNTTRKS